MTRRSTIGVVATLAFFVVAVTVAAQSPEPWLGTWKVNAAKSSNSPGPPSTAKSQISIWESLGGGQFKLISETVDAKGQTTRIEVITRLDGADDPVKGAAVPTTRTYRRIGARTIEYVTKVNGKVTTTQTSVVAADGKTRTNTTTGTNAQGQTVKNVLFYEKQ